MSKKFSGRNCRFINSEFGLVNSVLKFKCLKKILFYQWKIMIPKDFSYMPWVHLSFAVQVQWPDAFLLPFQNAFGRKKHTSAHNAMHFCSMGLHVVVPGGSRINTFMSWNKLVQHICVHVHVEICLNRIFLCTHMCYHPNQKKKTPKNSNNPGTWR